MKVRLFNIILIFLFVLLISTGCVTNISNMTSAPTTSIELSAEQATQKQLTLEEEYQYLWEYLQYTATPQAPLLRKLVLKDLQSDIKRVFKSLGFWTGITGMIIAVLIGAANILPVLQEGAPKGLQSGFHHQTVITN